jgi:hypothetical protein
LLFLEIASAELGRAIQKRRPRDQGPIAGTLTRPGSTAPPATLCSTFTFVAQLASRPVSINRSTPKSTLANFPKKIARDASQPNSASSLSAILAARNDPDKAAAASAKLSASKIKLPEFSAIAQEIVVDLRQHPFPSSGPIRPAQPPLHLKTRGEGILGARLAVA